MTLGMSKPRSCRAANFITHPGLPCSGLFRHTKGDRLGPGSPQLNNTIPSAAAAEGALPRTAGLATYGGFHPSLEEATPQPEFSLSPMCSPPR